MTINTFNTGRKYTQDGQRIAWTVIESIPDPERPDFIAHRVSFADADRGIDGVVVCLDDVTNGDVLRSYDHGGYGWDTDRDRVKTLYDAAREVRK